MGLSYLTKKNWNPSNMNNVRSVWEAEHREELKKKQRTEREKILKEEKQIEDLKRLQVKEGIIPQSSLTQIEWMYQDRTAFNKDEKTAEEFLLGKEVTERDLVTAQPEGQTSGEGGTLANILDKSDHQLVESFTTNENEAFLRMKEDPLVLIKQKELEQRQQVYSNPMVLKKIQKEIQKLKEGVKKSSKKDKKHSKKDKHRKKSKKHRRERSCSSNSADSVEDRSDRKRSKRSRHRRSPSSSSSSLAGDEERRHRNHDRSDRRRRRSRSRSADSSERGHSRSHRQHHSTTRYRRDRDRDHRSDRDHRNDRDQQHKRDGSSKHDYYSSKSAVLTNAKKESDSMSQQQQQSSSSKNLGPDMSLYGARMNQIQEMDRLRRDRVGKRGAGGSTKVSKLTDSEKKAKLEEMKAASTALRESRRDRTGYTEAQAKDEKDEAASSQAKGGKFLKEMRTNVYMESEMNLEDRINRQKHYRDRKELRKDLNDQ